METTPKTLNDISTRSLIQKIQQAEKEEFQNDVTQFLVFQVGNGRFGINILETNEILKPVSITRIPNVEEAILGVINLRGDIIPVIDLSKKFSDIYTALTNTSRIIVANDGRKLTGLLVERVNEVARLRNEQVENVGMTNLANRFVSRVGRIEERIFLILNLNTLFQYEVEEKAMIGQTNE